MPKVTKILGNNKARAWESLGFAHKKRLCQHFDTTSSQQTIYTYQQTASFQVFQAFFQHLHALLKTFPGIGIHLFL